MERLNNLLQNLYTAVITKRFGGCGERAHFITFSKFFNPHNMYIGDDVFINQQCILAADEKITIGNKVQIGFRVMLITSNYEAQIHHKTKLRKKYFEPITIKDYAWIGSGAIILPGITIGEGSVVGAGAIVTRDVPDYTVVGGIPARVIKKIPAKNNTL